MSTLYAGWTETQEQANTRWAWKQQRELCARIVETAKPVMDAMLATISTIDEPHPADVAFDLEALPEAEAQAAEVERDDKWLESATVAEMDADWEAHCKEVNDTRATDYPM